MDVRPIGVFDSGLGGLTAVKALEAFLPGENLIYFGDSRNAPYGTRPRAQLAVLAAANAQFLSGFDCKAILVACGTVSSNAMDVLRGRFPAYFCDVLEPACVQAAGMTETGRIAVIATEATIRSGAFVRKLGEIAPGAEVYPKACQSLVALAEAGHFQAGDPLAERAVAVELGPVRDWGPDVLILACTHFPLFQPIIENYMGLGVGLLSVGEAAARQLQRYLEETDALASGETGTRRYFTSGDPETFARQGTVFLGHPIAAEKHINNESENL